MVEVIEARLVQYPRDDGPRGVDSHHGAMRGDVQVPIARPAAASKALAKYVQVRRRHPTEEGLRPLALQVHVPGDALTRCIEVAAGDQEAQPHAALQSGRDATT